MQHRNYKVTLFAILTLLLLVGAPAARAAPPIGDPAFAYVWARQDRPVQERIVARSWTWGPAPLSDAINEAYVEGKNAQRFVQYFDKSRMEINDPNADPNSPWYVTNGLLTIELMTGRLQTGNTQFETRSPAPIAAIGDPGSFPTYADLQTFYRGGSAGDFAPTETPMTTLLRRDLTTTEYTRFTDDRNTWAVDAHNGYAMVRAFVRFMQQTGIVYENGRSVRRAVYDPWYVFGQPVTQPFWVQASVGGVERPILFQVFERRVLTYNAANPPAFQVEMGNVGQHYYRWRYGAPLPVEPVACRNVERIAPDSAVGRGIAFNLITTHPDLAQAQPSPQFSDVRAIDRAGEWVLLQAAFDRQFEPGIFVLRAHGMEYRYAGAMWAGQAASADEIRSYLAAQLPDAPPELTACLQPAEWFVP
jgi:hypothetical protein